MSGPWEKYQNQKPGPWTKYQAAQTTPEPYQPSMLESAAEGINSVVDPIANAVGSAANMYSNAFPPAKIGAAVMGAVGEGLNSAGEYVAEKGAQPGTFINRAIATGIGGPILGRTETAEKIAANPYVSGAAGMAVANAPMAIPIGETNISTALKPARGKPSVSARIRQMRTGVEASAFDQLRRDPMAFFQRTSRAEAGEIVGKAKTAAGINPGVTNDIKTLSRENLSKTRNLASASNKAQDAIADDIQAAVDLLGPNASESEILNLANVSPDKASTALDGINSRLAKLERSEGRGGPNFQKWTAIKANIGKVLESSAPGVRQANKEFSRVALRDKFLEPFPVNQAGTFSKINAWGFAPAASVAGGVIGGAPGAVALGLAAQAYRSPFVAGLGTAIRGIVDKGLDPVLSKSLTGVARRPQLIANVRSDEKGKGKYSTYIDLIYGRNSDAR